MLGGYGMYGYGYGYRLDPTIFLCSSGSCYPSGPRTGSTPLCEIFQGQELFRHDRSGSSQAAFKCPGIYDVTVQPVSGKLTDHYDP